MSTQLTALQRTRILTTLIGIGFIAISAFEVLAPQGIALWVLYIPLTALTAFLLNPRLPIWLASLSSCWMILDLIIIETAPYSNAMLVRRAIGILSIYSTSAIVRQLILVSANREITQRNLEKISAALKTETAKLERSNRELEQFAAVAAHDLRSPIFIIYSWTDLMKHLLPQPRETKLDHAIEVILTNAEKAGKLIDDVLAISRVNIAIENLVQVDLNKIIKEILTSFHPQIEAAEAEVLVNGQLPTVEGNETYLTSVFSNLIRNALIYKSKSCKPRISIGVSEQNEEYEFFVKDNGIGIDADSSQYIFEMFRRLHGEKSYPGTGIGLAFCKKVVELCGGKIWVTSILGSGSGSGSTFYFTYPKKLSRTTNVPIQDSVVRESDLRGAVPGCTMDGTFGGPHT